MMKKKSRIVWLAIALLCISVFAASVCYASDDAHLVIEQVFINKPEFNIVLNVENSLGEILDSQIDKNAIIATFGDEKLSIESITSFKENQNGTCYLFLIDISRSMPDTVIKQTRIALKEWLNNMGENDKFILCTFGDEIEFITNENDTTTETMGKIDMIETKANTTHLHDAINIAYRFFENNNSDLPARKIIVTVTDGIDDTDLSISKEEMIEQAKENKYPIYFLTPNSNKKNIEYLGNLARASRAGIEVITYQNTSDKFAGLFENSKKFYSLKCKSNTNITDGKPKNLLINIKYNNIEISNNMMINAESWKADTKQPTINNVEVIDFNSLVVSFSEAVTGAESLTNYRLKSNKKTHKINSIFFNDNTNEATIDIVEEIFNGDYILETVNINDISMEKNTLDPLEYKFIVTNNPKLDYNPETSLVGKSFDYNNIFLIAITSLILISIIAIILILVKRKQRNI